MGLRRAEELYEKVFFEYGDDSVAQLGGVHLACEQASNVLTKVLEWGRLMAYLEQSTRYIAYNQRLVTGHYRYYRDPGLLDSPLGARYVGDMDRMFDTYGELLEEAQAWLGVPPSPAPARRLGGLRAPTGGPGQGPRRPPRPAAGGLALQRGHLRHRAVLRDAAGADAVPPVARGPGLCRHDAGGAAQGHPLVPPAGRTDPTGASRVVRVPGQTTRRETGEMVEDASSPRAWWLPDEPPVGECPRVASVGDLCSTSIPMGRPRSSRPSAPRSPTVPEEEVRRRVEALLGAEEKRSLLRAYVGDRTNRRHRPGRAFERTGYRFDVVSDYGAFRDLQRHRMLTIEWQSLGVGLGYDVPDVVAEAGLEDRYVASLERSRELAEVLTPSFPAQAAYAVALAYRIRYSMQMNAREAMHLVELRSGPQGHASYRWVAQEMHRLIAGQAGHRLLAEAMSHVDFGSEDLERLHSERRAEGKRNSMSTVGNPANP